MTLFIDTAEYEWRTNLLAAFCFEYESDNNTDDTIGKRSLRTKFHIRRNLQGMCSQQNTRHLAVQTSGHHQELRGLAM